MLNMGNRRKAGGLVKKGGDSQEEDLFRRTDISLSAERFLHGDAYSCSAEDTVMVQTGFIIICGTEKEGYPVLDEIPDAIAVISVAVKKKPPMNLNEKTGKRHYLQPNDRMEIVKLIRLLLHAAMETDCEAVVLSALGCGYEGHDPEEVALMFKKEIYRVGGKVPAVYFAILDDKKVDSAAQGNYEVFKNILVEPAECDPKWKTAREVFNSDVMAQSMRDFPDLEVLGDAGGSGTKLLPGPKGEEKKELQTHQGDVPMGTSLGDTASYASLRKA